MYKKFLSIAVMFALILTFVPQYAFSETFKVNAKLENALKENLGIEELTIEELENLDYLWLNRWDESDPAVDSLQGIESAKKLQYVDITNHPIADLEPLKNLSLEKVALSDTKVSDLSPLKNLKVTDRVYLYFPRNQFTSLKGVENIQLNANTKVLENLIFSDNNLKNINELSAWNKHSFEYIEEVDFSNNKLTDIAPLTNLKVTDRVYNINLANNNLKDITSLAKFADKKIEYINVANNPLNAESLQLLYHLEATGTIVEFSDGENSSEINYSKVLKKWPEKDSKDSIYNKKNVELNHQIKIKFSDEVNLSLLKSNDVQVRNSSFELVDTQFEVSNSNTLVIKPKANYTQRSVYSIYISGNVKSAKGTQINEPTFYSFKTKDLTPIVQFKNKELEELVKDKVRKESNERVTEGDMSDITNLYISGEINNFTGLEKAVNLKRLTLDMWFSDESSNVKVSLEPLKKLPNLQELNIVYLDDRVLQANKSEILSLPSLKKVFMSEEQDAKLKKALEDKGIEIIDPFN